MARRRILLDTSFLVALFDHNDPDHELAMLFTTRTLFQPIIPYVVITEVAYLLRRNGDNAALSAWVKAMSQFQSTLEILTPPDFVRVQAILREYDKARFDLVDVCLMAMAERLAITHIATLDPRDFSLFKPAHCKALTLVP